MENLKRRFRGIRTRGLSLVELMVTIAVLAILATIAAPSFLNMIRQYQLTSTANEVLGLVQYARSEAVKRAVNITVDIAGEDGSWSAVVTDGTSDFRVFTASGRVSATPTPGSVVFDYLGRKDPLTPAASFAFVHESDGTLSRVLIVESSGRSCVVKSGADCSPD